MNPNKTKRKECLACCTQLIIVKKFTLSFIFTPTNIHIQNEIRINKNNRIKDLYIYLIHYFFNLSFII
jgi:hypothetical protein